MPNKTQPPESPGFGRRPLHLLDYDYSSNGAYFVTICTQNRRCIFGEIVDGEMRISATGTTVSECWKAIPSHFPSVELDAFILMPNHIHGIIWIAVATDRATHAPPRQNGPGPDPHSIGAIIGSFKAAATKHLHKAGMTAASIWQRNYFERVVRDDQELNKIREYIQDNPSKWADDPERRLAQ